MTKLRIGTRGSKLAMIQAGTIAEALKSVDSELDVDIKVVRTQGDIIKDTPLSQVNGQGFFVKEIENALLSSEVDIAVHSAKDLPTYLAVGLVLGAVSQREDPRDCVVSRDGRLLGNFAPGTVVGTSSLRRQAYLAHENPGIKCKELRGNVDTRLRKLDQGQYDAIIVAKAALIRLGYQDRITEELSIDRYVPAVAQGVLAVEVREDDQQILDLLRRIDDQKIHAAIRAERALLQKLQGGCQLPLGGHANIEGSVVQLHGCVISPDGTKRIDASSSGGVDQPERVGVKVANLLFDRGAKFVLDKLKRVGG